jgi:hypothetical protein
MRRSVVRGMLPLTLALALAGIAPSLYGQDPRAEIEKRLTSQFTRTKFTADLSDVAVAGSVLTLHKDGLLMCSTEAKSPPTNTYKNGNISMGFGANMAWGMALGAAGQQSAQIPQRKFVTGEKFWVTDFHVKEDGVYFVFFSDPFDDVRYYTQLKFPFPKNVPPPPDDVMKTIAEVITVDTPAQESAAPEAAPPPAQPAEQPAAAPKTIGVGQTIDQVVGILGQPQKIVNLGAKQIYYYPDMKVIFINGKVADVQ